ncbi:MAG: hypothetical protein HYY84_18480 [Deltaproteobacteria bacterium]|nr:hypothetical protein [Deltaproteobacteria bacterium]
MTANEFREIEHQIRLTPKGFLGAHLKADPRLARLTGTQRLKLLEIHKVPMWMRGLAFGLNFTLPGLGSLLQGDTAWGVASISGFLVGAALIVEGLWPVIAFKAPFELIRGGFWPGVVLALGALAISVVRPWVYENPRYEEVRYHLNLPSSVPLTDRDNMGSSFGLPRFAFAYTGQF